MDDDRGARDSTRFALMPQTQPGRRAAALLGAGVALIALTTLLANAGGIGGSPWLALMMIPAMAAILCGAAVAAFAVVRRHERGGVALIPVVVGLALVALLAGELIPPNE